MVKKRKRTLKEAYGEEQYQQVMEKAKSAPRFMRLLKKHLKEDVTGQWAPSMDFDDDCAVSAIHDAVVEGAEPNLSRQFVSIFHTTKPSLTIPLGDTATAHDLENNEYIEDNEQECADVNCIKIDADEEPGSTCSWTRKNLEDASWDVMARQARQAGRAIDEYVMDNILDTFDAVAEGDLAGGAIQTFTQGAMTWAEFVNIITTVECEDFHPDYVIMNPYEYGLLLGIDQFISSLYAGSDQVVRSGIVKTTLGVTVIRSSRVRQGIIYCVDSDKVLATVIRRDLQVEPFEYPNKNKYGFTASMRIGKDMMFESALCIASAS